MKTKFDQIYPYYLFQLIARQERRIKELVWHCTATKEGENYSAENIEGWHLARGWNEIGYNLVLDLKGNLYLGRDWNKIPAHVYGNNEDTLGFVYVGGLDKDEIPKDTRTPEQEDMILFVSEIIKEGFDILKKWDVDIKGHRDYSPDLNGDGIIQELEWTKECPCFDVQKEIVEKLNG